MQWRRRRAFRPQLSAAVIAYNVAPWLPACLESMLGQEVDDVQIVVVDDGSTDGSDEIARDYAARHPQIEVVRQENGGVSAARHTGIERCSGEYLTLVDSDDRVCPGAWSTMLRTLQTTGSDFVVGAAERVRGDERFMTPLMRRNHQVERLGIRIEDQPLMLADVFAWNKVFRRSFWDAAELRFPERTSYQDQPTLTRAFLSASSFDVLTDVVYEWTVRPDRSSATQQRSKLRNLRQRVETKRMTVELVREHGVEELTRVLFAEVLAIDMWEHFRSVPGCPDDYWTMLREAVREFWGPHSVPFDETGVPVQQRLMGCLVAQDRRADLVQLISYLDAHPGGLPIVAGHFQHPWDADPSLPPGATRVQAHDRQGAGAGG